MQKSTEEQIKEAKCPACNRAMRQDTEHYYWCVGCEKLWFDQSSYDDFLRGMLDRAQLQPQEASR